MSEIDRPEIVIPENISEWGSVELRISHENGSDYGNKVSAKVTENETTEDC